MIKLTEQQIKKIGEIQRMCIEHSIESKDDVSFKFDSVFDLIEAIVNKNGWTNQLGEWYTDIKHKDGLYGVRLVLYKYVNTIGEERERLVVKLYMRNVDDELDKALDGFIEELQKVFNS